MSIQWGLHGVDVSHALLGDEKIVRAVESLSTLLLLDSFFGQSVELLDNLDLKINLFCILVEYLSITPVSWLEG